MPKNVFKSNLALAATLHLVSTMLHIVLHWRADWWEQPEPQTRSAEGEKQSDFKQEVLDDTGCPEIVMMWWAAIATFTATFLIEFDRFLAIA